MATAIIRPTGHIDYSNANYGIADMKNLYDNDNGTYAVARRAISAIGVLASFDTSSIPAGVKNSGKITSIDFCILATNASNSDFKIRAVYGAISTQEYTDCGDGSLSLPLTVNSPSNFYECKVALPQATIYWQNNMEAFFNGGFQIRLYNANTSTRMIEAYAIVEYELPITVTTSVYPEEGGTVTGGGTYESGSTVTATAFPNNGYVFSHWLINGANSGNSNPISGALTEDTTVTAVFEKVQSSKIRYGANTAKSVFDTQKNKAKSVWNGKTQIL